MENCFLLKKTKKGTGPFGSDEFESTYIQFKEDNKKDTIEFSSENIDYIFFLQKRTKPEKDFSERDRFIFHSTMKYITGSYPSDCRVKLYIYKGDKYLLDFNNTANNRTFFICNEKDLIKIKDFFKEV